MSRYRWSSGINLYYLLAMIKLMNKIIKKIQKQHVDVYILNLYIYLRLVDDKLRIYMYTVYLQREFTNHIRK